MTAIYFYLTLIMIVVVFLGFKVISKRRQEKQAYEEREENVFYDAAKNIRRD